MDEEMREIVTMGFIMLIVVIGEVIAIEIASATGISLGITIIVYLILAMSAFGIWFARHEENKQKSELNNTREPTQETLKTSDYLEAS